MSAANPLAPRGPAIVVGFDGSAEARAALSAAAHHAGPLGTVYVVTCFDAPPDHLGVPAKNIALEHAMEKARERLADLDRNPLPGLSITNVETELLAGPPAEAILRVAEVRDADEIVIGSRGLGLARALLGSVSYQVIHGADRPVRVITAKAAERMVETAPPAVLA